MNQGRPTHQTTASELRSTRTIAASYLNSPETVLFCPSEGADSSEADAWRLLQVSEEAWDSEREEYRRALRQRSARYRKRFTKSCPPSKALNQSGCRRTGTSIPVSGP
uniref:Uncharacterized protein n=1 Tax=Sphaerodactylus townsendi TaxID=933632 RepID=A0ACB8FC94_9SAUR